MKLPYREGTWFAIPLRHGGFAVGIVARAKGGSLLCYFYGPRCNLVPKLAEVEKRKPQDALRRLHVGDLGLIDGSWPIIGHPTSWSRDDWPMPIFIRREVPLLIQGKMSVPRAWRVYRSDTDPNKVIREEREEFNSTSFEEDGLFGAGAVEIELTKLLA